MRIFPKQLENILNGTDNRLYLLCHMQTWSIYQSDCRCSPLRNRIEPDRPDQLESERRRRRQRQPRTIFSAAATKDAFNQNRMSSTFMCDQWFSSPLLCCMSKLNLFWVGVSYGDFMGSHNKTCGPSPLRTIGNGSAVDWFLLVTKISL